MNVYWTSFYSLVICTFSQKHIKTSESKASTIYPLCVCHTFTNVQILQTEAQGVEGVDKNYLRKASALIP